MSKISQPFFPGGYQFLQYEPYLELLTLPLLMARVATNYADSSMTSNHSTFVTDFFNARTDLHVFTWLPVLGYENRVGAASTPNLEDSVKQQGM
jgi:hypothetical protein